MTDRIILLFLVAFLAACHPANEVSNQPQLPLKPGTWRMNLTVDDTFIPIRFEVDSALTITWVNSDERIPVTDISLLGDSLFFSMPRFNSDFSGTLLNDSRFTGMWNNKARQDYQIPFEAFYVSSEPASNTLNTEPEHYEVWFSPGTDDEYKAVGLFQYEGSEVHGTFLTETGDYRYLQGTHANDQLLLSCFDGSHLFGFTGTMRGDSIVNGEFRSGKHWKEPWVAVRNSQYQLTHPDSLTHVVHEDQPLEFHVLTMSGDPMVINPDLLKGKVTIIQIFGSWCPNCYDENVFYKELSDAYSTRGLQIIPVAFEKSDDFTVNAMSIEKQFAEIGINYPPYLGGKASKSEASAKFPMLDEVISFPTSLFIDKDGTIRKVHTGFYGPGTGTYYETYCRDTRRFIEMLLAEAPLASI